MTGLDLLASRAGAAAFIAEYPDREVHWYPMPDVNRDGYGSLCVEYETGDIVLDETMGERSQVTCQECLEWMHA